MIFEVIGILAIGLCVMGMIVYICCFQDGNEGPVDGELYYVYKKMMNNICYIF
jgi:hypothetical protein